MKYSCLFLLVMLVIGCSRSIDVEAEGEQLKEIYQKILQLRADMKSHQERVNKAPTPEERELVFVALQSVKLQELSYRTEYLHVVSRILEAGGSLPDGLPERVEPPE